MSYFMNKQEILKQALDARIDEIMHYQINIDNYRLAIDLAMQDPDMLDFSEKLKELYSSSIIEQKKAIIMRDVLLKQLEE